MMITHFFQRSLITPLLMKHSPIQSPLLQTHYQDWIVKHHLNADAAQIAVLGHLQPVLDQLTQAPIQRQWLKWSKKQSVPRQVIWTGKIHDYGFIFSSLSIKKETSNSFS
jgi:hypothetical protein